MSDVLYVFNRIRNPTHSQYIFQYVKNRKLTSIYHSHDFYEIMYFCEGNATQLVNNTEQFFSPNSIILLRPTDSHCFLSQSDNTVVVSLSVRREEFELLANAYSPSLLNDINSDAQPKVYAKSHLWPYTDTDFEKISISDTESDYKFLLFCFLKAYIESIEEHPNMPKALAYAIIEIKKTEHLRRGIKAFTELSNYSQSHLARLMKEHFNMTLKQYINELRLQKAYDNIMFTQKSGEEISEELGFASYSHFNKIFKSRFSITPAALRKKRGIWTA